MINKIKLSLILFGFTLPLVNVFAHGEDKLGPNKGYVRMPGAFHTELVKLNDRKFKVYLLDMEWKNPTIENSTIEAFLKVKTSQIAATCFSNVNHFVCELPKKAALNTGVLSIKATRQGMGGGVALYELPLQLISTPVKHD